MRRLTFLGPAGLQLLLDLATRLDGRGIAFFAYNWQRQPMRLLDLIDRLTPTRSRASDRSTPTGPLRRMLPRPPKPAAVATDPGQHCRDCLMTQRADARTCTKPPNASGSPNRP